MKYYSRTQKEAASFKAMLTVADIAFITFEENGDYVISVAEEDHKIAGPIWMKFLKQNADRIPIAKAIGLFQAFDHKLTSEFKWVHESDPNLNNTEQAYSDLRVIRLAISALELLSNEGKKLFFDVLKEITK